MRIKPDKAGSAFYAVRFFFFKRTSELFLNSALSSYFDRAEEAGTAPETRLSISETFPVNSGEFSIVIANAPEHAVKACQSFPEEQGKIIENTDSSKERKEKESVTNLAA